MRKPRYYHQSISRINIFVARRFGLEPLNKGYSITFLVNVPFFVPSENVGKPLVGYELIVSLANSIITFSLQYQISKILQTSEVFNFK